MIYAIIAIVTVIALFLIFRDDHDTSYNKNEKRGHGAERSQYDKKSEPRAEFKSEPKSEPKAEPKSEPRTEFHREDVKDKVLNVVESIIKEVKEQTAEPMKEVQKAMDEAKGAFEKAMREAGQKGYWTSSTDVDEQEQPEAEELSEEDWENEVEVDLSFLDNLDYDEDLEENTETFDITGLRYHCTIHDCGKIVGYVKPEPSDVHDPRAQAVFRSDGKLLGYIPKTQLDWYEDFNEEDVVCPFVGEMEIDGRGWMQAEIKVIIPSSIEFVRDEIECEL